MTGINALFLLAGLLLFISVLASTISARLGLPLLLLFLGVGMLAGQDGPGGIVFNDGATRARRMLLVGLSAVLLAACSAQSDRFVRWVHTPRANPANTSIDTILVVTFEITVAETTARTTNTMMIAIARCRALPSVRASMASTVGPSVVDHE